MGSPWRVLMAVAVIAGLATPAQAQDLGASARFKGVGVG
jgi:hypothetical protein